MIITLANLESLYLFVTPIEIIIDWDQINMFIYHAAYAILGWPYVGQ